MIKRTEFLIKQIRQKTDNISENAISNDIIVSFLNDAQNRIQSIIYQKKPETNPFNNVGYIQLTGNTDEYSLDIMLDKNGNNFYSHMLSGQAITLVEVSTEPSLATTSFYPLKLISNKERVVGNGYFLRDKNIIITPKSNYGYLRITYPKKLPDLDIRRGSILSIYSNTLTLTDVPANTDFSFIDYVTIVDFDGNIKKERQRVLNYNSSTKTIQLENVSGISVGQYVCYGDYSTTHSMLDDVVERYLVEYACLRIFMFDSSKDINPQSILLDRLEEEIAGLYADNMNDVQHIPLISTDYMVL